MRSLPKHVLVTGASRGLGLAIVRKLLCSGYAVSALARTMSQELEQLQAEAPDRLFLHPFDVRQIGDGYTLVKDVEANGPLYALINNAAVAPDDLLVRLPESAIRETLDVNLTAAILLSRAVAKRLIRANSGRIVSISSIVAHRGSRGLTVYAATKAALDAFSRSLALELGKRNVTVTVVAPGYLDTDMTRTLTAEQRTRVRARSALPREVTVEDVAASVLFLLSDAASSITGTTIVVDGGSAA